MHPPGKRSISRAERLCCNYIVMCGLFMGVAQNLDVSSALCCFLWGRQGDMKNFPICMRTKSKLCDSCRPFMRSTAMFDAQFTCTREYRAPELACSCSVIIIRCISCRSANQRPRFSRHLPGYVLSVKSQIRGTFAQPTDGPTVVSRTVRIC